VTQNRKLTYRGRHVENLIQQSDVQLVGIDDQYQFPDTTTLVPLAIKLTQEQYVQILSALSVGAFIVSDTDAIETIELFLQLTAGTMNFCDEIAECITNSETVRTALSQWSTEQQGGLNGDVPTPISPSESADNLLPTGYTCDDNHLCGMARWIVNNLHDGTVQLIQQIENATNLWELFSIFVDNVEGVSWFGSALEFAAWAQDQLEEYYQLAWSATVEDELTCDVFCEIQPDCEVTLDGLISAYESAVTSSFSLPTALNTINDLWNWLEGLDYETAQSKAIVGSFHWVVLQALRFGTNALGFTAGVRSLKQMIATGSDETDTYCSGNCACSPPPIPLQIGGGLCYANVAGSINEVSPNIYDITTAIRPVVEDYAFTVESVNGETFQVTSIQVIAGNDIQFWGKCNNGVNDSAPNNQFPLNQPMQSFSFSSGGILIDNTSTYRVTVQPA
jgi:hypothetical protein